MASKASRTRSMYFSCQVGYFFAAKMVIFFGLRGSNVEVLPLDSFLARVASEEVMLEEVLRT